MLARSMQNPKQIVCKRVLGLEGDEVRIPQSTQLGPGRTVVVYSPLSTASSLSCIWPEQGDCFGRSTEIRNAVQVPKGHVWLQGDNFINSTDSRHYGPVPYALLRGRAFLKVTHARPRPASPECMLPRITSLIAHLSCQKLHLIHFLYPMPHMCKQRQCLMLLPRTLSTTLI